MEVRLLGQDDGCVHASDVLTLLESLTGTTVDGFGRDHWVFRAPKPSDPTGASDADGSRRLATIFGFDGGRGPMSLVAPRPHVTRPLQPRPDPADVVDVERWDISIRVEVHPSLTDEDVVELTRVLGALVDELDLTVADVWGFVIRRDWFDDYVHERSAAVIDGAPRRLASRKADLWLIDDVLYGLPIDPTTWFWIDGDEVVTRPATDDRSIGELVHAVLDRVRYDRPDPDVSKRFPDGEKLIVKAAGGRTKTEVFEQARRVRVTQFRDLWELQPVQFQGVRKPWYVNVTDDPPFGLYDPTPEVLGATMRAAFHHFDGR